MGLLYKVSPKELLEIRNKIFLNRGVPALNNNGFQKSPFSSSWFGRNNLKDFTYELCRLSTNSNLEYIIVHISRGDRWIKIFLNIFNLEPEIKFLEQLNGLDAIQFHLPPNSISQMRLRSDDYKGPPIFYMLFDKEHKLGSYHSKSGLGKRIDEFGKLIEGDMNNIDSFIKRWHELQKPAKTNWEGHWII